MTGDVERIIRGLASAVNLTLPAGLTEAQFLSIGSALAAENRRTVTRAQLERIVGGECGLTPTAPAAGAAGRKHVGAAPAPPALECCTPRMMAGPSGVRLRHTCRKWGQPVHRGKVTQLHPFRFKPGNPHPACKAAWTEGEGVPCAACAPLLHPDTCDCPPCREFWATVDVDVDHR